MANVHKSLLLAHLRNISTKCIFTFVDLSWELEIDEWALIHIANTKVPLYSFYFFSSQRVTCHKVVSMS